MATDNKIQNVAELQAELAKAQAALIAQSVEQAANAMRLAKLQKYEDSVARATEKANRKMAHDKLLIAKAIAANLTISDKEIDIYMAAKKVAK